MDKKMTAAVNFVKSQPGREVHAADTRIKKWIGDGEPDTLNRCFSARVLSQVQIDDDDYVVRAR